MREIEQQGCQLKPIVIYSSKSGNTERIAKEIASELHCLCEKIDENFNLTIKDLDNFDLVFLGTGNYGAKPNAKLLDYLKQMNLNNSRTFALFLTWCGRGTSDKAVYHKVKAAVEAKGQKLLENYYSCLSEGHSLMARVTFPNARGHPTAEDLSNARKWAKDLAKTI